MPYQVMNYKTTYAKAHERVSSEHRSKTGIFIATSPFPVNYRLGNENSNSQRKLQHSMDALVSARLS